MLCVLAAVASFLLKFASGVDNSSLMFVNTGCTGEEFQTGILLPALRLAIEEVNNKMLTSGHQLHFCNEKDFESTTVQVSHT